MNIQELLAKIKPFYPVLLILVLCSIFGSIWRLGTLEKAKEPLRIEYGNLISSEDVSSSTGSTTETVIGSKTGKKYYFPWCGTLNRIKPENKITFSSIEEARRAGYSPGGGCKGLQ